MANAVADIGTSPAIPHNRLIVVGTYAPFQDRFNVLLDLLLVGGAFALGPDFRDKLRARFAHGAKAQFAAKG